MLSSVAIMAVVITDSIYVISMIDIITSIVIIISTYVCMCIYIYIYIHMHTVIIVLFIITIIRASLVLWLLSYATNKHTTPPMNVYSLYLKSCIQYSKINGVYVYILAVDHLRRALPAAPPAGVLVHVLHVVQSSVAVKQISLSLSIYI